MKIPPPKANIAISKVQFGSVSSAKKIGHRVCIYGSGGIGKTTLGCRAPGKVAFADAEDSLPILKTNLSAMDIPLPLIIPVNDWQSLRATVRAPGWESIGSIALEITRIEEWAVAHTLKTVNKDDKGTKAKNIEDYGYGKGYKHVFDTFILLLMDLDKHVQAGRNVILIAHDCVQRVPNPAGEDFIRWEPRLQNSEKCSIRSRVKEWCDHVLFYSYDIDASKDGKASGGGTKTIYTSERPHFMAKSRTTDEQINVTENEDVWGRIIK